MNNDFPSHPEKPPLPPSVSGGNTPHWQLPPPKINRPPFSNQKGLWIIIGVVLIAGGIFAFRSLGQRGGPSNPSNKSEAVSSNDGLTIIAPPQATITPPIVSPTTTSSATASPTPSSTSPTVKATPHPTVASKLPCELANPSLIKNDLGFTVSPAVPGNVADSAHGIAVGTPLCTFTGTGVEVAIAVERGQSSSTFAALRGKQSGATDVSGLGDAAFSISQSSGQDQFVDVAVLKADKILIVATKGAVSLDQIKQFSQDVLSNLGG